MAEVNQSTPFCRVELEETVDESLSHHVMRCNMMIPDMTRVLGMPIYFQKAVHLLKFSIGLWDVPGHLVNLSDSEALTYLKMRKIDI